VAVRFNYSLLLTKTISGISLKIADNNSALHMSSIVILLRV